MIVASIFNQIAYRIIKEQELIIGPLAWDEARKVSGLQVLDSKAGKVDFKNEDPKLVVDKLVAQYERLFGQASHEVCRDAVADLIAELPVSEVPASLQP
ncbi:MAG: hypothetical protein EXS46_01030 [Candidatus Taylorbacteria bacterium]|nr:hypothetical protein [Candidatus Taylorbacteria bacterium]